MMNEKVLPAPGRVLIAPSEVDPSEQQQQTPSGLFVVLMGGDPGQTSCALTRGVVLACGEEVNTFWDEVTPGSTVLYHGHAANPVGENHLLPVNQIAAVVEG